eukprot:CAMPEP_0172001976 /NCGR_PEP_ID=MMETSP1041-20130122/3163_1 /TAXON_ID=464988 /ORGANISM="Hemiselmis andersenii, Strain CCMP439" /LENGTH=752 /DNA_ID=CAMNT_0012655665 /DNA_START=42 /DNA_END=2296 /DNA_ORIENTATION=-
MASNAVTNIAAKNAASSLETSAEEKIIATIQIWGVVFAVSILFYCYLRTRFRMLYSPRALVPALQCDIALRELGMFGWIKGAFLLTDDELIQQAGLDAACFIRWLHYGLYISLVGVFNMCWMVGVFYTASENPKVKDSYSKLSLANTSDNDARLFAPFFATYIIYGVSMFLIRREFAWYIAKRHDVLSKKATQNYSIYVSNIPTELRSVKALRNLFNELTNGGVAQVAFAYNIKELEDAVAKKELNEKLLNNALHVFDQTAKRPRHSLGWGKSKVDSIEYYEGLVREATSDATRLADEARKGIYDHENNRREEEKSGLLGGALLGSALKGVGTMKDIRISDATKIINPTNILTANLHTIGTNTGFVRNAAFITFNSLHAHSSGLHMLHDYTPGNLTVFPGPKKIMWDNVGLPGSRVSLGRILAKIASLAMSLLWTIPMSFIASLTEVENLTNLLPFLVDVFDKAPWITFLFNLLSPLLIVWVILQIPKIMRMFSMWEGHVSATDVGAATYAKVVFFTLTQVFFVSAISSSLLEQLQAILDRPILIVDILAQSLPTKSVYFINYLLVKAFLSLAFELLRPFTAVSALIRRKCGPKHQTEKMKGEPWRGFNKLQNPGGLALPGIQAHMCLCFMVTFTYSALAPIAMLVTAASFGVSALVYRQQYAYVYDPRGDSGGTFWPASAQYAMSINIVSLVVIIAVIGAKQGFAQMGLLFPLLVVLVLFKAYHSGAPLHVAKTLPSRICVSVDAEREAET